MSSPTVVSEWDRVSRTLDANIEREQSQQQQLFRLFQALHGNDLEQVQALAKAGAPLDIPLILSQDEGAGGPPQSDRFRFQELAHEKPLMQTLTALGYAAGRGMPDQVDVLLRWHAGADALFDRGRDAAWLAMELGQIGIMEKLLGLGVAIDLRADDAFVTPRIIAATKLSSVPAVEALLRRKARPNATDRTGRTALFYNFQKDPYSEDDRTIGRLLLAAGADPQSMDPHGTRAMEVVHTEAQAALLRQHGLEHSIQYTPAPPEPKPEPVFDDRQIVHAGPDDPGIPQLQNPPVLKKPRF